MPAVVEVVDLSVRYGPIAAVSDASFTVEAGQTVALIGENGAGKTSSLLALLGTIPPAHGTVRVFGQDPMQERARLARRWGVMPQSGGLPMGLKAGECVQLFADLYGRSDEARSVVEQCGLAPVANRRWRTLSGGQQQRLSLAVALVAGPDLLVLDEPTAAMDVNGQQRVLRLIRQRCDDGCAVLLTTHRMDEVELVADRIVVLHHGEVRADESLTELISTSPQIRVRGLDHAQLEKLNAAVGTHLQLVDASDLAVGDVPQGINPQGALQAVLAWCGQHQISATEASVGRRSLADVYQEIVAE
ncbi:MAG: ABC transporter ATP-binding protein [Acidimicrobiales bacterium]|nr:ABC transporter ATP-binding protein [Acidimicrobiales bacterium]